MVCDLPDFLINQRILEELSSFLVNKNLFPLFSMINNIIPPCKPIDFLNLALKWLKYFLKIFCFELYYLSSLNIDNTYSNNIVATIVFQYILMSVRVSVFATYERTRPSCCKVTTLSQQMRRFLSTDTWIIGDCNSFCYLLVTWIKMEGYEGGRLFCQPFYISLSFFCHVDDSPWFLDP